MSKASQYSELATGMYGSSMIYGVMGEIDSPDDVKRLLNGKKDREGYKQAFLDHAHLAADAAELPVPVCRIEVRILFEILLDHHRGECTCREQCEQRNDFFSC